ncbi:hypothetical protein ACH5RR_036702 [Cinchona calisaya]|uniref:Splicing factor RBM39 linker domain-containing protein n=1 Tax=Cinchona calisaya TaxID=153742 RepID=A0ABD2Y5A0_9GENT
MLMAKLDRSGIASSVAGSLGVPALNGAAPAQQAITMPIGAPAAIPSPVLPAQVLTSLAPELVGNPCECLLLKNMFDPATETDPEFDLDIWDDVHEECSKYELGHLSLSLTQDCIICMKMRRIHIYLHHPSLASPRASMPFSSDQFIRQDIIPLESSSSIPFHVLDGMSLGTGPEDLSQPGFGGPNITLTQEQFTRVRDISVTKKID